MELEKGINSYVTLEEAEDYFSTRLDSADWQSSDDDMKIAALITSARLIDNRGFIGEAVGKFMAFPRNAEFIDTVSGRKIKADPVPKCVILAQLEQAHHLLLNEGAMDESDYFNRLTLDGVLTIEGLRTSSTVSGIAYRLLRPLLFNGDWRVV